MKCYRYFYWTLIISFSSLSVGAQAPVNGFMQGKGKGSAVISYYTENYIRAYESPPNSGTQINSRVKSKVVSAFTTFGLSKEVDLQINLPYSSASGEVTKEIRDNIGPKNEKSGLQDISIYVKYNPINFKFRKSNLSLLGAAGLSTPFGDYEIDQKYQSAVSIGSRSTQLTGIFLLHYKLNLGLFFTGSAGYSVRSNHVPNAAIIEFKTGFAGRRFYVDGYLARQTSSSTESSQNSMNNFSAFSGSNINYARIGFNLFIPVIKKFGIAGGLSNYLNGRSEGETGGYGALIYTF
jgi:hypothetical protein